MRCTPAVLRVVSCVRNAVAWLPRHVASLRAQYARDWHCHLVDDASDDGSAELAARLVAGDPRFTTSRTPAPRGRLGVLHAALQDPAIRDDDVVVPLDGTAWLGDADVLGRVAAAHAAPGTWVVCAPAARLDGATPRDDGPPPWSDPARARAAAWPTPPFAAFVALLWRQLRRAHLLDARGAGWDAAADLAWLVPMLEMAGAARVRSVPGPACVHGATPPDDARREELAAIRRLPPHALLPDCPPHDPAAARVTVVMTPRERFGRTREALATLLDHTAPATPVVVVASGAPPALRAWLRNAAAVLDLALVEHPTVLPPNAARTLGLARVRTPYALFVDNDVETTPGWADALVACADATGAAVVGPLYVENALGDGRIHMAGGFVHRDPPPAPGRPPVLQMPHRHHGALLADVGATLRRERCDYLEFHTMLVRTDFLRAAGGLDPGLLSLHEHVDVGLLAARHGAGVWFEPASVVAYHQPPPWEPDDVALFLRRWSDAWNAASVRRFDGRWACDTSAGLPWARGFRRRLLGSLVLDEAALATWPADAHAAAMLAVLDRAGRDDVDVVVRDARGWRRGRPRRQAPPDVVDALPALRALVTRRRRAVHLRAPEGGGPALLVVRAHGAEARRRLAELACLLVEDGAGGVEAWVAVDPAVPGGPRAALAAALAGTDARVAARAEGLLAGVGAARLRLVDARRADPPATLRADAEPAGLSPRRVPA